MAPSNGTTSTLSKMVVTLFPHHSTLQWQIAMAMAPSNGTTSTTPSPHHSTLQWHPAMAPRPLHSTLEGHPAMHTGMAPSNGTTSTPLLPPTIAHYNGNGTQQWHHVHPPKVGRRPPPEPYHTTMAPYHGTHGTQPLHPAMAGGCHVQSAKVVRRPPPLLEVRTPIAIAIWGIKTSLEPSSSRVEISRLTKNGFPPVTGSFP